MRTARTYCAHCNKQLKRRQIKDDQKYCSRACMRAESLAGKAVSIPRGTLYQAHREGRVREREGEVLILSRRRCAGCGQARGIRGSAKLCQVCQLDSAWCSRGQHVVHKSEMPPGDSAACYEHAKAHAQGRNVIQIPAGWVPLKVAADRMGYTSQHLCEAIARGWMRGKVQKIGGRYFIVDWATYPVWEWALV